MASGCVVVYNGKRGRVFRIKFTDAGGHQHMDTLGREKIGSQIVWTRRKAEKALAERLVEIEAKRWRPSSPLTFEKWTGTWLEQGQTRRAWKPRTIIAYKTVIDRLCETFGNLRLTEIGPRDVAAYVAQTSKTKAPATVSRDVSILYDILKVAVRQELIYTNPAAGAERPRVRQRRWRILKPAEVALVSRSFAVEQDRVVFLVLVICGLRRHELQALRWRDVDLVDGVLRVVDSKTEDGVRSIAIPPSLAEALTRRLEASNYQGADERVFCHPEQGTVYRAETFRPAFNAALKKAGITEYVRPFHDLRHTAITNDAAAGSSPIAVMTKAGHANMSTTKRYLHLAGVVFRDEAQRLEERYGLGVSTEPSTEPVADSGQQRSAAVT